MANIYVRSTDGSNVDNGSTWALAKATMAGAAAGDSAGDTIYVSQVHAESTASAITLALAGTVASPTKVICGNDGAAPPTAVDTAGSVSTTGNSGISITGASYYVYGLTFNLGDTAVSPFGSLSSTAGVSACFEGCNFKIPATGGSANYTAGSAAGVIVLRDCGIQFANAGQVFSAGTPKTFVSGGSLLSGGTSPTGMFRPSVAGLFVSGFDLSNASAGVHIFYGAVNGQFGVIRNSKLPASWSGNLVTGTLTVSERYELYNCDAGDVNYAMQIVDYAGTIIHETTVVRTGGASDGTTSISWKLVSTANAEYPHITLNTPEIVQRNDAVGSSMTATVEVITDNVTLTDGECWLEVQYLGTSGFPLASFASDAKADVLATAANQATSTETWTTTGLTTPVKQKLVVTFTPQEVGYVHAVVKLAKASTTVYVCPKLTLA